MAVVRGQFDKFLRPGARKVYVDEYKELPAKYTEIFNIDTSGKSFEDDLVSTGLPIAVTKPEGEPIAFDRPIFRGRVRYIHSGYGLGYEVTREAVEDDVYKAITSQGSTNLARSIRAAEETTAANVFNNAFSTTQAYDGVALLSTSHTDAEGGSSFANKPSSDVDLSVSALKSSMERFFDLKNDRNLRIEMMPDRLLVSNSNWWAAREILGTQFVTGAASGGETTSVISERAKNVTTEMGLMPIRWAYLTDSDAWFTLAPKAQTKLFFFWRRKPDMVDGFDGRTQISWFAGTARWSVGATDWRGIDGSSGA